MTNEGVVHGRGMVATAAIAADEVLFEIPRAAMLSSKTSAFGDRGGDSDDAGWAPLLFAMMAERQRGQESPWAPYFAVLPEPSALSHPHFWPEGEADALLGNTRLVEAIQIDREAMRTQFDAYVDDFTWQHPNAVAGTKGGW